MDDAIFLRRHRADSFFWLLVWLYIFCVIIIGFEPPVRARFFDGPYKPASWILIAHVWSAAAWIALFAVQAWLAAVKRLQWHRRVGQVMLPLATVIVTAGLASELALQQKYLAEGGDNTAFLAVVLAWLVSFFLLVIAAWHWRRRPAVHKRLVLMASAALLAGAHDRAWSGYLPEGAFDAHLSVRFASMFGGWIVIVAAGMFYDRITRGRVHPAYWIGGGVLTFVSLAGVFAYDSVAWSGFARRSIIVG